MNLPIDVTVAKEIVEQRVVEEEGCLVLLEKKQKNCRETRKNSNVFSFKKGVSVRCSLHVSDCGQSVPRFDRERLCSTTRASLAGVWAARLIALSGQQGYIA